MHRVRGLFIAPESDRGGADLSGLPITEVVAKSDKGQTTKPGTSGSGGEAGVSSQSFVILYSGDGGWAELVKKVSARLAAAGVPVVGVSSPRYFLRNRNPDALAADVARMVAHYSSLWHRDHFVLAGFSFGADVAPFIATHLSRAVRSKLSLLVLLSPLHNADFQFSPINWFRKDSATGVPIEPELAHLDGLPVACLYGSQDKAGSLCTQPAASKMQVKEFPGDHHMSEKYDEVAKVLLDARAKVDIAKGVQQKP